MSTWNLHTGFRSLHQHQHQHQEQQQQEQEHVHFQLNSLTHSIKKVRALFLAAARRLQN